MYKRVYYLNLKLINIPKRGKDSRPEFEICLFFNFYSLESSDFGFFDPLPLVTLRFNLRPRNTPPATTRSGEATIIIPPSITPAAIFWPVVNVVSSNHLPEHSP